MKNTENYQKSLQTFSEYAKTADYNKEERDYKTRLITVLGQALTNSVLNGDDQLAKLREAVKATRKEINNLTHFTTYDDFEKYLAGVSSDKIRKLLTNLFNESLPLASRVDSFKEGVDEDYPKFLANDKRRIQLSLISCLLAARDPEKYIFYRASLIDRANNQWGLDLASGNGLGEKYASYLGALKPIQEQLTQQLGRKADLVDVHSLLWYSHRPKGDHDDEGGEEGEEATLAEARSAAENLIPDSELRRQCLSVLANSIMKGNSEGASSWGLTLRKGPQAIQLNVGNLLTFRLHRSGNASAIEFLIDKSASEQLPEAVRNRLNSIPRLYPNWEAGECRDIPVESFPEVARLVQDAHNLMIEQAAKRQKRTSTWRKHSTALMDYLREFLVRPELPDPGYVDELNTKELISRDIGEEMPSPESDLYPSPFDEQRSPNWIYFGPPGTGKTWSALHEVTPFLLAKNFGAEHAERYDEALNQDDKDEVKKLAKLLSGTADAKEIRYWWVSAKPSIWSWDDLDQKNHEGFKRGKIRRNYDEIAEGDLIFGYAAAPIKALTTIARVKELVPDGESQTFVLELIQRLETPIKWAELRDNTILKQSEPIRLRAQGTLFKLDELEAAELERQVRNRGNDLKFDIQATPRYLEFVTFHQSYSYEDFVEGLRPVSDPDGNIRYEVKDGIFKRICKRALQDPKKTYTLIIDEINRGNISKIFGELITLIESDKRVGSLSEIRLTLPYSGEDICVPPNLLIIGTMNTADRSIALLDVALRRRFTFKEVMPDPSLLTDSINSTGVPLDKLLDRINRNLEVQLDRDHQIGHSYFMNLRNMEDLVFVWEHKVIPLLQEYFYGDGERLLSVLGKELVRSEPFKGGNGGEERTCYQVQKLDGERLCEALRKLAN